MKYKIKTKIENGIEKVDARSHSQDKRKMVYLVMDEKGQTQEVDKKWLVAHIDNIVNLGLSGNSLYLKVVKSKKADESKKVEIKKDEPLKIFNKVVFSEIEKYLPFYIEKIGINDVTVIPANIYKYGNYSESSKLYKLEGKTKYYFDHYPFDKCYLALLCQLHHTKTDKLVTFSLVSMSEASTMDGLKRTKYNTFAEKEFNIGEVKNRIKGKIENYNNLYCIYLFPEGGYSSSEGINYYIPSAEGEELTKNALRHLKTFVKAAKIDIEKYTRTQIGNFDIDVPYQIVEKDGNGTWKMPNAEESIKKAIQLEKKGYKIVVNYKEMSAADFKLKVEKDLKAKNSHWGSMNMKYYRRVFEYIDKKKKIFYVKVGPVSGADLWC